MSLLLGLGLFAYTGLNPSWRTPESTCAEIQSSPSPAILRVLALNVGKCGFYSSPLSLAEPGLVRTRMDSIARVLVEEDIHIAFLSEIVWSSGLQKTNQVRYISNQAGMPYYVYGDNYRFGLPFLSVRTGNAILSRLPLRPHDVQELVGTSFFWNPTGNRRAVWADCTIWGESVLLGSIRTDSFDLVNNARQVRQLIRRIGSSTALLGGDFNAEPGDMPIVLVDELPTFISVPNRTPTFPAHKPERCIDYLFAPSDWKLSGYKALHHFLSDHLAVVATFARP